jgi:proline iminopeptidase
MTPLTAAEIPGGTHINIGDTRLFVQDRGTGYPIIVLHGGPGLDHRMWGDYLDPLLDRFRLILVDQRAQGRSDDCPPSTWTLEAMAADVTRLAQAMSLARYAVLGHSYGAFVTLQHAVDFPGHAAYTIVSSGLPSVKYLAKVQDNLASFEPLHLREQVASSWAREAHVDTQAAMDALLHDQLPFQFGDPLDPRIPDFERRSAGGVGATAVLRHFAVQDYGGIEVEARLGAITQPVLVLAGRGDRTCVVEGATAMAAGIPNAQLVVFEHSGHMTYVEENERYLQVVRAFLANAQ